MNIRSLNSSPVVPKPCFAGTLQGELIKLERKYIAFVETCVRMLQENHLKLRNQQSFYEPGSAEHDEITAEKCRVEKQLSELGKTQRSISFSRDPVGLSDLIIKKIKEVALSISGCQSKKHNNQIKSQFDILCGSIKELLVYQEKGSSELDIQDDADKLLNDILAEKEYLRQTINRKETELKRQDKHMRQLHRQFRNADHCHSRSVASPSIQMYSPRSVQ